MSIEYPSITRVVGKIKQISNTNQQKDANEAKAKENLDRYFKKHKVKRPPAQSHIHKLKGVGSNFKNKPCNSRMHKMSSPKGALPKYKPARGIQKCKVNFNNTLKYNDFSNSLHVGPTRMDKLHVDA